MYPCTLFTTTSFPSTVAETLSIFTCPLATTWASFPDKNRRTSPVDSLSIASASWRGSLSYLFVTNFLTASLKWEKGQQLRETALATSEKVDPPLHNTIIHS